MGVDGSDESKLWFSGCHFFSGEGKQVARWLGRTSVDSNASLSPRNWNLVLKTSLKRYPIPDHSYICTRKMLSNTHLWNFTSFFWCKAWIQPWTSASSAVFFCIFEIWNPPERDEIHNDSSFPHGLVQYPDAKPWELGICTYHFFSINLWTIFLKKKIPVPWFSHLGYSLKVSTIPLTNRRLENINRLPERFGVGHWQLFREILQIDGLGDGTFGHFCRSCWESWEIEKSDSSNRRGLWFGYFWLFFGGWNTTQFLWWLKYPLGEGFVHIPPMVGKLGNHRLISVPAGKWSFPGGVDHKWWGEIQFWHSCLKLNLYVLEIDIDQQKTKRDAFGVGKTSFLGKYRLFGNLIIMLNFSWCRWRVYLDSGTRQSEMVKRSYWRVNRFPPTNCGMNCWDTVDGTKSCTTKDDDYPIIYRVLTIPGGAGFRPSTVLVVQWKWTSLVASWLEG